MLIKQELKEMFNQLAKVSEAKVVVDGIEIIVHTFSAAPQLSFATTIWKGDSYIPKSVRSTALKKPFFLKEGLETSVSIDEAHFTISLHFASESKDIPQGTFIDLLEEFSWQANEWRLLLEEKDRGDLVHVRAK